MSTQRYQRAYSMLWFVLAVLSALFSASAAIAQKKILFSMSALEFSFAVSVVIAVLSSTLAIWVDVSGLTVSTIVIIAVKSLISGVAFLLVMTALEANPISSALPLLGLTPAVTALLALPALGETLQWWEVVGVLLMAAGTYILEYRPGHSVRDILRADWTERAHYPIFGALVLFAISSVLDRKLVGGLKVPTATVLVYQHIIYCLVFGIVLAWRHAGLRRIVDRSRAVFPLLLLVALLTIAYRYLQLQATASAPVALVLAVKRSSILIASLVGGRLFKEERLRMKLVGATIIVGAGFLILRNVG